MCRKPELPDILRPPRTGGLHAIPSKLKAKAAPRGRKRKVAALGKVPQNYDPLRAAFYVATIPPASLRCKLHYHDIDLLIPEALHAVSAGRPPGCRPGPEASEFLQIAAEPRTIELPVMSMVNNYDGKTLVSPRKWWKCSPIPRRANVCRSQLAEFADAQHQPGIVVDFERCRKASQPDFRASFTIWRSRMHAANLKLMVALPAADWSYDYKYLAAQADAIILMNYDFHCPTSDAGPIAPQDWFERNIENMVKIVPPEKIVMGIANYGYDWPAKSKEVPHPVAQPLTFQQGIITAVESESDVTFDPDSLNPHYSYEDEKNQIHNVWMLDSVTAYNELRAAERAGVRGTALWRLGMEDPSIWFIWDATHPDDATRAKIEEVPPGYDFDSGRRRRYLAHHRDAAERPAHIRLRFRRATSSMTRAYQSYPLSWRIEQMGAAPHKVALTFDDGPDPDWTPKILDILESRSTRRRHFSSSANPPIRNPESSSASTSQGNEIGNHTFTHPEFETISKSQLQIRIESDGAAASKAVWA